MGKVFPAQLSSRKTDRAATSCVSSAEMGLRERLGQGESGARSSWVVPRWKAIGCTFCTESTSYLWAHCHPEAVTEAAWCPMGLAAGCSTKSGLFIWRQEASRGDLRRTHGMEQEGKRGLRGWEKSKHKRWPKVELAHIGPAECRA